MSDHLLVSTQSMALTCAHCGTVEPFKRVEGGGMLVAESLQQIENFNATHATCPKPVFKPGDRVEFCGEQATVVENYGNEGLVDLGDGHKIRWYWMFQGTPVIPVKGGQ